MAAIHAACFTDAPRPWSAAAFRDMLGAPGVFLVSVPEGFALGRVGAGEAELLTLAVQPQARRQGLGRRLLAGFEAEAARRGAEIAYLEVAADNRAARVLYAARGYAETGRRPRYYAGRTDAVLMRKRLG